MSPREWRFCIADILGAVAKIDQYVLGMELGAFLADDKTQDAVVRLFILIGEAARHIPSNVTEAYPDVPWQEMRDMRNFAVHVYWGVTAEVLWDTIRDDLPALVPRLRLIMDLHKGDAGAGNSDGNDVGVVGIGW